VLVDGLAPYGQDLRIPNILVCPVTTLLLPLCNDHDGGLKNFTNFRHTFTVATGGVVLICDLKVALISFSMG
jgi:hypothetical protein